jgi:D-sedoheptulose 7-phosphate isomerase
MSEKEVLQLFEKTSRLLLEFGRENAALITHIAGEIIDCFEKGNKLLLFGNGGSAAQAQHFAAELVNKLSKHRKALPAIALSADTPVLTSIGNDIAFADIFSRQIEALGQRGDVAWGISTSGNSPNIIKAFEQAKAIGIICIAFSGKGGGKIAQLADITLIVPSQHVAGIQELHLCSGHAVCELIETHFLTTA